MRQKSVPEKEPATQVVKNIRRATRRKIRSACTGRPAQGGQYRRALQPRGNRQEPLLPLVERLSRGGEQETGWRYGPADYNHRRYHESIHKRHVFNSPDTCGEAAASVIPIVSAS